MPPASARPPAGPSPSPASRNTRRAHMPGLLGRYPAVAAKNDALVGRLSSAVSSAVVDDVGFEAGGLHSDAEPGQGVIPGDPGLGGGLQRLDSAFGQGQLVQRDTFSGGFRHSGLIQGGTRGLPMELAVAVLAGQSFISTSIRSAMR